MAGKRIVWFVVVMVVGTIQATSAKTIYVDDDANGLNNGTSWVNAYRFLQEALADAATAEKPVEIRVAQGAHMPDRGVSVVLGDQWASFRLINGVTIKGSFAGIGQPDPNARDIVGFESILSGDLDGDDLDVNTPEDLRVGASRGFNSLRVVIGSGTDSTAVLDGFTISRGCWTLELQPPAPRGGSAMFNDVGSPTVIDCTFKNNACVMSGGGVVYNRNGSNPTLIRCAFIANYSERGPVLFNGGSSPVLENCTFRGNVGAEGGAILNSVSNVKLVNCIFSENIGSFSAAIANEYGSTAALTGCVFRDNSARSGGAISITEQSRCTLTNCVFETNTSHWGGGGAICVSSEADALVAVNCLFVGNRTLDSPVPAGGAVTMLAGTSTFANCTFSGNWAREGHAIYFDGHTVARLRNCVVWDSSALAQIRYGDQPVLGLPSEETANVEYSDVLGGFPGIGNVDADPLFAEAGYWADPNNRNVPRDPNDPNSIWVNGDYHLKSQAGRRDPNSQEWVLDAVTSPCIDAGDPNSPIGNEPQPNGGRINMGFYGGKAEASKSHRLEAPVVSYGDNLQRREW